MSYTLNYTEQFRRAAVYVPEVKVDADFDVFTDCNSSFLRTTNRCSIQHSWESSKIGFLTSRDSQVRQTKKAPSRTLLQGCLGES